MTGFSFPQGNYFKVLDQYVARKLIHSLNTILVGTVDSFDTTNDQVVVNIFNNCSKVMQDGNVSYESHGMVSTKFITPSCFQYSPNVGDRVIILVSQSDIQGFLNNSTEKNPTIFNISDSVVFPVFVSGSNTNTIVIGDQNKDVTLLGKSLTENITEGIKMNCNKFNVVNTATSDDLLLLLSTMLTALATVPVQSGTIDSNTGGLVSQTALKLQEFAS